MILTGLGGGAIADPFGAGAKGANKIHVRVQQRNGRKCITTVQGLDGDLDLKRICKAMKKAFNCNGSIEADAEWGEIIQLQGDQRDHVRSWLVEEEVLTKPEEEERLVIHGF